MSGRKHHLLRDHRNLVDYRQVPVLVPVPIHDPAHVPARALPQTNPFPREPPPENKFKASAVMADELMSVFYKADTGRYRPIHRPIPRMPEGMGIETNSNNA